MAHLETRYQCPICHRWWSSRKEAETCRNTHPITEALWAIGRDGKKVMAYGNCKEGSRGSIQWAMREADLSDDINVRRRQLAGEHNLVTENISVLDGGANG